MKQKNSKDRPLLKIKGPFLIAEKRNGNGRLYRRNVLETAVQDYYRDYITPCRALGELGHPDRYEPVFADSCIKIESIKQAEDDIGVISGKGTNTMVIENNPLLYASTTSELQTYADGMLDYVKDIVYVPVVVESYDYADIPLGQYFTIDMSTKAICMSISQSASGFIYKCTGNQLRENQVNQENM